MLGLKNFILVCGHYGCGKTNFAMNLALDYKSRGEEVTLVDMDLVNPYFRCSDYRAFLDEKGIELIAPTYGGTNLDLPSLPSNINAMFIKEGRVIVDVGGDDVGATVLGRFRDKLSGIDYDCLYLVNMYRNLTQKPEEALEVLREIEAVSGIRATHIVNNSHLKSETTKEKILASSGFAAQTAKMADVDVIATVIPETLENEFAACGGSLKESGELYPVSILVKTNWE